MSVEKFAAEYEKKYFNFCYALQSEERGIRNYIRSVERLFDKLEREMKKLVEHKPISVSKVFSIADKCFIGYHNAIRKAKNPSVIEFCLGRYKLSKDARVILGHLLPSSSIDELVEENKHQDFRPVDY